MIQFHTVNCHCTYCLYYVINHTHKCYSDATTLYQNISQLCRGWKVVPGIFWGSWVSKEKSMATQLFYLWPKQCTDWLMDILYLILKSRISPLRKTRTSRRQCTAWSNTSWAMRRARRLSEIPAALFCPDTPTPQRIISAAPHVWSGDPLRLTSKWTAVEPRP